MIKYLTCPKCENNFYIMEEFANKDYKWFCPKCQHHFTEKESENDNNNKKNLTNNK